MAVNFNSLFVARVFKDIVSRLESIEQFSVGAEWEQNQLKNALFPHLFVEFPSIIDNQPQQKLITFSFLVMDRTLESAPGQRIDTEIDSHAVKILSKTEQIVDEVLGMLQRDYLRYVKPQNTYNATPIIEDLTDRVYGWRVTMTLAAPQTINSCELPEITVIDYLLPDNNCFTTPSCVNDYITCADLDTCQTIIDIQSDLLNKLECSDLSGCQTIIDIENELISLESDKLECSDLPTCQTIIDIESNIDNIEQDITDIQTDVSTLQDSRHWYPSKTLFFSVGERYTNGNVHTVNFAISANQQYWFPWRHGTGNENLNNLTSAGLIESSAGNFTGTLALYEVDPITYAPTTLISQSVVTSAVTNMWELPTSHTLVPGNIYSIGLWINTPVNIRAATVAISWPIISAGSAATPFIYYTNAAAYVANGFVNNPTSGATNAGSAPLMVFTLT